MTSPNEARDRAAAEWAVGDKDLTKLTERESFGRISAREGFKAGVDWARANPPVSESAEAAADRLYPKDSNGLRSGDDYRDESRYQGYLEGYSAGERSEKVQKLAEALKLVRDVPGLGGMDHTSTKKWRESSMKVIENIVLDALAQWEGK